MKNILIIMTSVLLLTSCVSKRVEVRLLQSNQDLIHTPDFYQELGDDTISYEHFNNIEVVDNRKNQEILGIKEYGSKKIEVINNQDLASLIKDKIIYNLKEDGHYIDQDKTLQITFKTLKYSSQGGFFLGKSKVKIALKAALMDYDNNHIEYGRTYNLENEGPYFIISLEKADQRTINKALRDAVDQITDDSNLQDALVDQNNIFQNAQ